MPNKFLKLHHKSQSQLHNPHHVAFPSSDSSSVEGSDDSHQDDHHSKHNVLRGVKRGLERIRSFSSTSTGSSPKKPKPSIKSLARAAENVAHVILNDNERKRKASRVVTLPSPPTITVDEDDNDNLGILPPAITIIGIDKQDQDQEIIPVLPYLTSMATNDEDQPQGHDTPPPPPPPVYVEPAVPDPFLIDEADSSTSEDEIQTEPTATPLSPSVTLSLPSPVDVNKAVPPPPTVNEEEKEEQGEEQAPELYIPGLVLPTMFLPIPNTDPLTTLLNKYIYPPDKRPNRDLTGEWQHSNFHTLVITNSWRALARMACDRIVTTDPAEDLSLILGLWYLRLSCLSRLRLFNQTTVECNNLFSVLSAVEPPESKAFLFERILPFELEVMQARLKYWAGDHMSYLDELCFLLDKCKTKARSSESDSPIAVMWKERGARISLIMASQLMEMKSGAACKLLEPLLQQQYESEDLTSPALRSAIARMYLQSGHLSMAKKHINIVNEDRNAEQSMKDMNEALLASACGEWETASRIFQRLIEENSENFVAMNNLSVTLLAQGKLKEGIEVLERALKTSPSSVVGAEPFLFNLSTLYELRSTTATQKKLDLLIEVAKWSGDGLKIACLKMPSN
ncbi:hypothetical protein E1B28_007295 [Marasmius oreades]|uniref:Uncharacterized protein n=1 Tax=Marasmius oreades TaxID=181124 RepID=A0A9P7UUS4_9AGAR|nr:uncharacterized protein E1B28_007295 [Marasmius oreades]KAG7093631.1 hypothetical protein E1B28_007295 [Marasmius oreades]